MPEVSEIRNYADLLRNKLKGKNIIEFNILKGRYIKHGPFSLYEEIVQKLPLKVLDVNTKGKFLYITMENNYYIFSTTGTYGGWLYFDDKKDEFQIPLIDNYISPQNKKNTYKKNILNHLNIQFKTESGSIYYHDTLSFGTMKVVNNHDELAKKLKTLGPDIMEESTTLEVFKDQLLKKTNLNKAIGNVLVNQKIISGIGNYLRADILWCAKISPFRKVQDLSEKDIEILYKKSKLLTWGEYDVNEGIKLKHVSTIDKLPRDYNRNFFVYMCKEDIDGHKVKTDKLFEGSQDRTIHWVPSVQK
jgi:formamidopyrimidine-DNA glycosylase